MKEFTISLHFFFSISIAIFGIIATTTTLYAQKTSPSSWDLTVEIPVPSGGSDMLNQESWAAIDDSFDEENVQRMVNDTFDGYNFDDNSTETGGFVFIPPDPIGAAGIDRLISVVNVGIESRSKTGTLLWRDSLADFFSPETPVNFLFDPKVVFDPYENRFVVVALEREDSGNNPDPGNISRILLAVSINATPATATSSDWYYHAIDSKITLGVTEHWADYPGFEVDEEAVYVTNNLFSFVNDIYAGVRLWIVDKGVSGGFYDGGAASVSIHDPYAADGIATTSMPAQVYGAGGVGSGIGTYLVSYSGLNNGIDEFVQVVRVADPLGSVSFTQAYVNIGNIEDFATGMPDAPQSDTATLIETNDRRALDAVWRNNDLWLTTTIVPPSGPDAGEATAHWIKLNATSWPPTLSDQGDIGGEDIATDTYTFFPSLAVNNAGDAYFSFSASAASIYGGAYCAGRMSGDATGTIRTSETVIAGVDFYERTFGGPSNRWGDYSGMALDPTNDSVFWAYNEYAMTQATPSTGDDGRWGTAWGACSFTPQAYNAIYIKSDGCGGLLPCFPTVQSGIDAASTGNVLNVFSEVFNESVVHDQAINLPIIGGYNAMFTAISGSSTINDLSIEGGQLSIENLTIMTSTP